MPKLWFIMKDGKQCGPIAPEELKRKAADGELQPEDHVRPDDRESWFKASAVKGLFTSKNGDSLQRSSLPPSILPLAQAVPPVEGLRSKEENPTSDTTTSVATTGPSANGKAMTTKLSLVFVMGLLCVGFLVWHGKRLDDEAEKARQDFTAADRAVNEADYQNAMQKIAQEKHEWNRNYSELMKSLTNPDFPTGDELDEMDRIGDKKNPTLNETERYNSIKARTRTR
jgi:hypothetical protein